MFNAMNDEIKDRTAKLTLSVMIRREEDIQRKKVAEETSTDGTKTVRGKGAVPLNAPCPCGSGLKYKRCCGKNAD
jgi:preprotein translocase subunit SecA